MFLLYELVNHVFDCSALADARSPSECQSTFDSLQKNFQSDTHIIHYKTVYLKPHT